jgi:hypothetical protein
MPGLAGFNAANYDGPIFDVVKYSAYGKPFADAVYGGIANIRKSAHLSVKARTRQEVTHKDLLDMYDATLEIDFYADKIKSIYNWFLLLAMGPMNFAIELPSKTWYNFVDNGVFGNGRPNVSATGSWLLGGELTFNATDKDRTLKVKASGSGYRNEMQWLIANSAAAATGGSSGAAITGLTTMSYDLAQYGVPGLVDVTVDGVSLGALDEGVKFNIDFKAPNKIATRMWPVIAFAESNHEIPMLQVSIPNEILTSEGWALADHTINFIFGDGLVISYVNSLVPTINPEFTEEKMGINKIGFRNRVPIDRPAWGANNINFNVASNTITIAQVGYAAV